MHHLKSYFLGGDQKIGLCDICEIQKTFDQRPFFDVISKIIILMCYIKATVMIFINPSYSNSCLSNSVIASAQKQKRDLSQANITNEHSMAMDVICSVLRICGDSVQPSVTQPQEQGTHSCVEHTDP